MNVFGVLDARSPVLRLGSVDDYLGPSTKRFFGSGYSRVDYSWRTVGGDFPTAARVRGIASVDYPADWSRKAEQAQLRPHLSTIDALILGVRAAELSLAKSGVLAQDRPTSAWLRRVDIKAGLAPVEDMLDEFPVEAVLGGTQPLPGSPRTWVSTVDCTIAAMAVRCEIEHGPAGSPLDAVAVSVTRDGQLSGDHPSWYGGGYRRRRQSVRDVLVDPVSGYAEAVVTVDPGQVEFSEEHRHGRVDTVPVAAVSMLDSFVATLQLGQILLYEIDGVSRAESNTLWMRNTTISVDAPHRRAVGSFPMGTSLIDSRRIVAQDEHWRTATIFGACRGVQTRCSVAHRLPRGK